MQWRIAIAAFWLLLLSGAALAQVTEGRDYISIDPRPPGDGERVEVIEFFYYGCRSCYLLEPVIQDWAAVRAGQIDFRLIPALRRRDWMPLSDLFFALHSLDLLPRLHARVYAAIHERDRNLASRSEQLRWIAEQGVDPAVLQSALDSDATRLATQHAHDATVAYGVGVTPTIVIDGRFLTTGEMLGHATRVAPVLDRLVEMAADLRAGAGR